MVSKMKYDEKPNYNKMREIFQKGLTSLGFKDMWKLALPIGGAPVKDSPKVKYLNNWNIFLIFS